MFVTRVTSSNNVSPSRGNNEVSGVPVRGDVVDLITTMVCVRNRVGGRKRTVS